MGSVPTVSGTNFRFPVVIKLRIFKCKNLCRLIVSNYNYHGNLSFFSFLIEKQCHVERHQSTTPLFGLLISLSFYIFFLNAKDFSASITQIKSAYTAQLYCKVVFKVV